MANETERKPWGWIALAAAVVLVIIFAVTRGSDTTPGATSPENETGPIRFGAIAPLTGDAAAYGLPIKRTLDLLVEQANATGGMNGRNIEVIWEDGKCDGTNTTTAAQKLLNVDKVNFIFGGLCSTETLAIAPLTQQARAILLSSASSSPDISSAGDLVYRTYPSDAYAGKILAAYAEKELKADKVAIISENTDFAQGLRNAFKNAFPGEEAIDETYNTGDTDFRTLANKVENAEVDVVYLIVQSVTPGELLLKQLEEGGVEAVIFGSDPMLDRTRVAENPSLYEGVILPELAIDETAQITKDFFGKYKEKYGTDPEFPSFQAAQYDAFYITLEAMKAVGTNPEKIAEYYNTKVKNRVGMVGNFNFDGNGDAILDLHLRKIMDGKITDMGLYKL